MKNIFRRSIGIFLILLFVTLTECKLTKSDAQKNTLVKVCTPPKINSTLTIMGNIVKLSDIDKNDCASRLNVIQLFATEKVVIDKNLDLVGDGILLAIMAPTWQVISDSDFRKINLNGISGKDPDEKRAQDGDVGGNRNGADGLAGQPGGPAGSFVGVANIIENVEKLEILANGGAGGAGQDGGNGAAGEDGETYIGSSKEDSACNGSPLTGWKGKWNKTDEGLLVYGLDGKRGGTGGNGGVGGMGGNKGNIKIFELSSDKENSVKTSSENGVSGKEGLGGRPGMGGNRGNNTKVICPRFFSFRHSVYYEYENNIGKLAESGFEGKSGVSLKLRKLIEKLPIQNIASTVNDYKVYLRLSIASSKLNNEEELSHFYNNLMEDESIAKLSDTLSLVEEFTSLERQHFNLYKGMSFAFSYEALQKRIASYIEGPDIHDEEYINVLNDLNQDILDRQNDLKDMQPPFNMTTNVKKELTEKLLPLTTDLQNLQTFRNTLHLIKRNLSPLDSLIKEGAHMINEILRNALSNLDNTLNDKMYFILNKITHLKNKVQNDPDDLENLRQKLTDLIKEKAVHRHMSVLFDALGTIYPAVAILALTGATSSEIIKAKEIRGRKPAHALVIPGAFKQFIRNTANIRKNDFSDYRHFTQQQEEFMNKLKEGKTNQEAYDVGYLWSLSLKLRQQLHIQKDSISFGYKMMKMYLNEEVKLGKRLDDLEIRNHTGQSRIYQGTSIRLRAAKYLTATSALFYNASKTVIELMKDENAINEINTALIKSNETLKYLDDTEETCTTIKPMLNELQTRLDKLLQNKGSPSRIQSVLTQNIHNILRRFVKIPLPSITNSETKQDLFWAVNDCINQFTFIFEFHNQLARHAALGNNKNKEENQHVGHISNLLVSNPDLQYALSELQVALFSNIVVEKYQEWISDFKQYAFPYTGPDLEHFQDLDVFKDEDTDIIANKIRTNVTEYKDIFSFNNDFTNNRMYATFEGSLSKSEESKIAIYEWKNEDFKEAIDNILSGEEGLLFANIRHNFRNSYDALKFKLIQVLFVTKLSENDTSLSQENLNSLLNNFNVELTHNGSSSYKLDKYIYKCLNTPTVFKFSYSLVKSDTFGENSEGFYILSPYTTWSIKLIPLKNGSFNLLEEYKGKVNLELIGSVEYDTTSDCDENCKKIMAHYYKAKVLKRRVH